MQQKATVSCSSISIGRGVIFPLEFWGGSCNIFSGDFVLGCFFPAAIFSRANSKISRNQEASQQLIGILGKYFQAFSPSYPLDVKKKLFDTSSHIEFMCIILSTKSGFDFSVMWSAPYEILTAEKINGGDSYHGPRGKERELYHLAYFTWCWR